MVPTCNKFGNHSSPVQLRGPLSRLLRSAKIVSFLFVIPVDTNIRTTCLQEPFSTLLLFNSPLCGWTSSFLGLAHTFEKSSHSTLLFLQPQSHQFIFHNLQYKSSGPLLCVLSWLKTLWVWLLFQPSDSFLPHSFLLQLRRDNHTEVTTGPPSGSEGMQRMQANTEPTILMTKRSTDRTGRKKRSKCVAQLDNPAPTAMSSPSLAEQWTETLLK